MKIAVIPNLTRANSYQITLDVCKHLKRLDAEYYFNAGNKEVFSATGAGFLSQDEMLRLCDVVIAVGGDGTILHAAKISAEYGKAVLGINAGRLAFMAGLEADELDLLDRLINNSYEVEHRMMLKVEAESELTGKMSDYCINDAVIDRAGSTHIIELSAECDGQHINNYLGDGVIIATPTGSTAYSLSAGGPVIDPQLETITLTPVCTHSLFSRSLIFKYDKTISIRSDEDECVNLSCDGEKPFVMKGKSTVRISKAEIYADFIRIKSDTFIDVLNSKLAARRV
ncbi:MAG: NAD(+)/NADH kinase [Clostridiales bacterium]|nr:NAD(+)/NADH kinase [Clostridiales bacterium]